MVCFSAKRFTESKAHQEWKASEGAAAQLERVIDLHCSMMTGLQIRKIVASAEISVAQATRGSGTQSLENTQFQYVKYSKHRKSTDTWKQQTISNGM